MKKMIAASIIALTSASAHAYQSSIDPHEYYTGIEKDFSSPIVRSTPVAFDDSLESHLAAEGVFLDQGAGATPGPIDWDKQLGNTLQDLLEQEGIFNWVGV